ncbi:hypothetical protein HDV06_005819 [Boothiomyces sp. JEL0866]|nr:hypothetical protein HDV06_005819 [Boothiomyces sp. JEL0866]
MSALTHVQKKQRLDVAFSDTGKQLYKPIKRTSDLASPIMQLSGHQKEVLTCLFSPDGRHLASGSGDKTILLWNNTDNVENYGILKGHQGAVLQVQWARDSTLLYSCSTDTTVGVFDLESGEMIKKCKGHKAIINSISVSKRGPELISSVGDDGAMKVWDIRLKNRRFHLNLAVFQFEEKYPLTACAFSFDGSMVFAGGIENEIKAWDLRKGNVGYLLSSHNDTITGLCLSPNGDLLLSNAMDNTVKIWDIKPFALKSTRLLSTFEGAPHGFEKNLIRPCWSPDADYIACGSGDRSVVVWERRSGKMVYKLPGHKGCVNQVDWYGNVLASCSNDKTLFLGELNLEEVQ